MALGSMREATKDRLSALADPDVALVALAFRLADMLDDPDASAATAKEYRATLSALTAGEQRRGVTLDDLDDE